MNASVGYFSPGWSTFACSGGIEYVGGVLDD